MGTSQSETHYVKPIANTILKAKIQQAFLVRSITRKQMSTGITFMQHCAISSSWVNKAGKVN